MQKLLSCTRASNRLSDKQDHPMPDRMEQLHTWICKSLGVNDYKLQPASEDASFRRYFRLQFGQQSFIVMDAPPERESCEPFIDIAHRLLAAGVHVPEILEVDMINGFVLLSDLGSRLYLGGLTDESADALYDDALAALLTIQQRADVTGMPLYSDSLLQAETNLFTDWLLGRHLQLQLADEQRHTLNNIFALLKESALSQPQVFVHRDYHSRNLMICEEHNPGILDFQDAVIGPLTYDPVSLLKDCYIKWPRERINAWAMDFYYQLERPEIPETEFQRWFDLMGVQRHLKASGIFARLFYRDGKPGYLKDIPRTLSYIVNLESDYPELGSLADLLNNEVLPALTGANQKCAP
jgi:aminoglycoside/choline kinase family phosphotransferase